jgi:hypothetical protein
MSAWRPALLTEIFCGFLQFFHANAGIIAGIRAMTASLHVLSNSLFINYPII